MYAPSYRKCVIHDDLQEFVLERFEQKEKVHDLEIEAMEIAEDHVNIIFGIPSEIFNSQSCT